VSVLLPLCGAKGGQDLCETANVCKYHAHASALSPSQAALFTTCPSFSTSNGKKQTKRERGATCRQRSGFAKKTTHNS
jgi:hypothetical protein